MKAYDLEITGSLITSGSLTVKDDLDVKGIVSNKYLQGGASNALDAPYYNFDGVDDYILVDSGSFPAGTGDLSIAFSIYSEDLEMISTK